MVPKKDGDGDGVISSLKSDLFSEHQDNTFRNYKERDSHNSKCPVVPLS